MAKVLRTLSHPDFSTKGIPLTKEEADQDLIEIWNEAESALDPSDLTDQSFDLDVNSISVNGTNLFPNNDPQDLGIGDDVEFESIDINGSSFVDSSRNVTANAGTFSGGIDITGFSTLSNGNFQFDYNRFLVGLTNSSSLSTRLVGVGGGSTPEGLVYLGDLDGNTEGTVIRGQGDNEIEVTTGNAHVLNTLTINSQLLFTQGNEQLLSTDADVEFESIDINGSSFVDSSRNVTANDISTTSGLLEVDISLDRIKIGGSGNSDNKLHISNGGQVGTGSRNAYALGVGSDDQKVLIGYETDLNIGLINAVENGVSFKNIAFDRANVVIGDTSFIGSEAFRVAGDVNIDDTLTINSQLLFDLGQEQNLGENQSVTFATVNTGHGNNELYPMNQAVRTSDSVEFAGIQSTGRVDLGASLEQLRFYQNSLSGDYFSFRFNGNKLDLIREDPDASSPTSTVMTADFSTRVVNFPFGIQDSGNSVLTSASIGNQVQAWDDGLQNIADMAKSDGNFIVGDGTDWVAESGNTARTSLGLGTSNDVEFNSIDINGSTFVDSSRNVNAGRGEFYTGTNQRFLAGKDITGARSYDTGIRYILLHEIGDNSNPVNESQNYISGKIVNTRSGDTLRGTWEIHIESYFVWNGTSSNDPRLMYALRVSQGTDSFGINNVSLKEVNYNGKRYSAIAIDQDASWLNPIFYGNHATTDDVNSLTVIADNDADLGTVADINTNYSTQKHRLDYYTDVTMSNTLTINSQQLFTFGQEQELSKDFKPTFAGINATGRIDAGGSLEQLRFYNNSLSGDYFTFGFDGNALSLSREDLSEATSSLNIYSVDFASGDITFNNNIDADNLNTSSWNNASDKVIVSASGTGDSTLVLDQADGGTIETDLSHTHSEIYDYWELFADNDGTSGAQITDQASVTFTGTSGIETSRTGNTITIDFDGTAGSQNLSYSASNSDLTLSDGGGTITLDDFGAITRFRSRVDFDGSLEQIRLYNDTQSGDYIHFDYNDTNYQLRWNDSDVGDNLVYTVDVSTQVVNFSSRPESGGTDLALTSELYSDADIPSSYVETGDDVSFGGGDFSATVRFNYTGANSAEFDSHIKMNSGGAVIRTAGSGSDSIRIYDDNAGTHIIQYHEGGNADMPNGVHSALDHDESSDIRIKEKLASLDPLKIAEYAKDGIYSYEKEGLDRRQIGLIAQYMDDAHKDLVHWKKDYKGYDRFGMLSAYSVASVALAGVGQVDSKVKQLKQRVAELEEEVRRLQ